MVNDPNHTTLYEGWGIGKKALAAEPPTTHGAEAHRLLFPNIFLVSSHWRSAIKPFNRTLSGIVHLQEHYLSPPCAER